MEENFTIHSLITFVAAVSFFAPLVVLLSKKLITHPFFSWFAFYWALSGLTNLLFLSEWVTDEQYAIWILDGSNYVDGLLMLFLLYQTQGIGKIRKKAAYIVAGFALLSIASIVIRGFENVIVAIIGVGVALVLLQLGYIILNYLTSVNKQYVGSSRLLLYYALVFEYGTSIVTYLFTYVFTNLNVVRDSFLLYHVSIIISTTLACFAIGLSTKKRKPQPVHTIQIEKEVEIQFL